MLPRPAGDAHAGCDQHVISDRHYAHVAVGTEEDVAPNLGRAVVDLRPEGEHNVHRARLECSPIICQPQERAKSSGEYTQAFTKTSEEPLPI